VAQLDANAGATAAIAEMLLQSHTASCALHLLPALPPRWPAGAVWGLRARGRLSVDLRWAGGRLAEVRVTAERGALAAPPSPEPPLALCCAPRICGTDAAALSAKLGTPVRGVTSAGEGGEGEPGGEVWRWEAELARGSTLRYAL